MASCPECQAKVEVNTEEFSDGELIDCGDCGQELEIVFLDGGGLALIATEDGFADDLAHDLEEDDPNPDLEILEPSKGLYNCLDRARR